MGSRTAYPQAGLPPIFSVRQEEFFNLLRNTPRVERVEWATSKASQGNVGKHQMEHNVKVWVPGFASNPLEFELTRNQHMDPEPGRPFTVTAMFKDTPDGLHAEAWRILLHVVQGRELFPQWAQQYAELSVARWGGTPLDGGADEGDTLAASSGAVQQDPPGASPAKKSRGASPP